MVLDEGYKIADVACRLGVGEGTLGNWVRPERTDRGERAGLTTSEEVELAELRRENAPAADGTRPAQTSDGLLGDGVGTVTRYLWVAARKAEGFPITAACKVAEVSTTAYDDWRRREAAGPTAAELAEARLVEAMREIHAEFDGTYGEPRMTPELRARGWVVNHKRVERLMCTHGIVGVYKPPWVRTTIPAEDPRCCQTLSAGVSPLEHPMSPASVTSPTSPRVKAGCIWRRCSTSARAAGSATRWPTNMRTELVADALTMAAGARGGLTEGIIFHGDRGSQYLSREYRDLLEALGTLQSVGRTGVCWDNSVAEVARSSLKRELVHCYVFPDRASARRAIFA